METSSNRHSSIISIGSQERFLVDLDPAQEQMKKVKKKIGKKRKPLGSPFENAIPPYETMEWTDRNSWSEGSSLLGEKLEQQLTYMELVNRATQCDWRWARAAAIWGNARLLRPTIATKPPRRPTQIVKDAVTETEHEEGALNKASQTHIEPRDEDKYKDRQDSKAKLDGTERAKESAVPIVSLTNVSDEGGEPPMIAIIDDEGTVQEVSHPHESQKSLKSTSTTPHESKHALSKHKRPKSPTFQERGVDTEDLWFDPFAVKRELNRRRQMRQFTAVTPGTVEASKSLDSISEKPESVMSKGSNG